MSEKAERSGRQAPPLPGGDFRLFLQKLGYQGLIALGLVENPLTTETSPNLGHARALIDDLMMLRDKTEGHLTEDEQAHLAKWIGDLQFHFVKRSGTAGAPARSDAPN